MVCSARKHAEALNGAGFISETIKKEGAEAPSQ